MKLFAILLLVGFAAASSPAWQWQTGKEHLYEYSGRLLTGIPELASHYSGLGIKCEVSIQVKSMDEIRLTLHQVRFSHVNGKLEIDEASGFTGNNWRHVLLPGFTPAPEAIKRLLLEPIQFAIKDGEIRSVTVSGAEEQWSLNFKKALVVLLQTKMEKSVLDLEMNTINKESYETKNYWKVSEETTEGVCDVIYQVNELPEYFVKENRESFPRLELCTGSQNKYYEITKTKDLQSCKKSSIYSFMKPAITGECNDFRCMSEMFGTFSSVTRYYGCGSRSNLILQFIDNEGEGNLNVNGHKSENIVSGTKQVLKLKDIRTIQHQVPQPTQPRVIESLSFEYVPTGQTLRSQIGLIPKLPQSELKNSEVYKYLPRHFIPNPNSEETKEKLSPQKVKTELKVLFKKVVEELMQPEDIHKKEVPMKLMSIVRAFTLLKSDDMKSLYEELKQEFTSSYEEKKMFQNLYFDSVTVSGTTPAVLFLKEMIKSEEMTKVQAIAAFALMPHHIMTPSTEVFSSLYELITSEVVKKSTPVYNTAIMGFSNLIQKACLSESRKTVYPTAIFGEFCDPQSEIVTEKWIPYLTHQLKHTKNTDRRNLYVLALGTLSHKDVVPTLLPIVQSNGPTHRPEYMPRSEFEYRNVSRYLSIYALGSAGQKHPELVLPIVFSIYNNPAENTEVRIAAFNTLMSLNPPVYYLQKVATSSWSEKDSQVERNVFTYILSLSQSNQVISLETASPSSDLVKKCQLVLPLLKPVIGYPKSMHSSATIFSSDYLPKLGVGYKGVFSWINNYKSVIPSDIYTRIEYILGGYQFKPFEVAFKLYGGENIYQNYNKLFNPYSTEEASIYMMSESEMEQVLQSLPTELRNKITELPKEKRQKVLSLPEQSIRRFCELPSEMRQKLIHLNQYEVRKVLTIASQDEQIRILNLPEEERRVILEKMTAIGGRYNSESRREAMEHERYQQQYGQTGRSTTGTQGMSQSGLTHFERQFNEIKDQLHQEWSKVIDQLKVESRENGPLTALAYINLFDDVTLFGSLSDYTTQYIHEKITPLLMNPHHYKSKVCGKTPFSFQRFMNAAPTEVLIPTDMGFPIIIEYHMPLTISVRGHVDIDCQTQVPSFTIDTKIVSTNNMHSFVGTYCPFTKQMVATGIKQERVLNIPVKTTIKFDSAASKFKIIMVPFKTNKPIDIIYSSVKPFTVAKSIYSFKPITDSEHYKHIKSSSPVRKVELPFGSVLGLNLKTVVESETRFLDTAYIMKFAKMYNYSPLNFVRFTFTPSVNEQGYPTWRRHEFRVIYTPSNSDTQEIETTITVGVASKSSDDQAKYYTIGTKSLEELRSESNFLKKLCPYTTVSYPLGGEQRHPIRQNSLQKVMLEKLNLKSGAGLTLELSTILKGSRPRTFTYRATMGAGINMEDKHAWDLELQSQPNSQNVQQKICIKGSSYLPSAPLWDLDMIRSTTYDFQVKNIIGFGQSCQESKVILNGNYIVSSKQKQFAKESPVARECEKLIERQVPGARTSPECKQTAILAKTIDEIDYKIQYVNVPQTISYAEAKVMSFLKAYLFPYVKEDQTFTRSLTHLNRNREVAIKTYFNSASNTIDVVVVRPEERVAFRGIPNKCPITNVMGLMSPSMIAKATKCPLANPVLAVLKPTRNSIHSIMGQEMPTCHVEKNWLTTFDNKSMPLKLDDCFHLVSGDCSSSYRFGVLARSIGHTQNKEVKIYLNKTEVIMTPSSTYSKYSREVRIEVNGTHVHIEKDTHKTIRDENRNVVFTIYKSKDNVIEFRAPVYYVYVRFNGERLDVESSPMMKNKICGLCGDFNGQRVADLSGPKKCIFSEPEVKIASYRINSPHCSVLEGSIKEKLQTETAKCAKYQEYPTEVFKTFISLVGKCSRHEHMILERVNEVCFSRVPITQCGAQCSPKPRQLVSKKVSFTCMTNGRIAELYREKVIQGQELPELNQKHESFTTSILVPQSCVSVTSGRPMVANSGIQSSIPAGANTPTMVVNGVPTGPHQGVVSQGSPIGPSSGIPNSQGRSRHI